MKKKNSGALVIVLILALGGAGGYFFFTKVKNKKPKPSIADKSRNIVDLIMFFVAFQGEYDYIEINRYYMRKG